MKYKFHAIAFVIIMTIASVGCRNAPNTVTCICEDNSKYNMAIGGCQSQYNTWKDAANKHFPFLHGHRSKKNAYMDCLIQNSPATVSMCKMANCVPKFDLNGSENDVNYNTPAMLNPISTGMNNIQTLMPEIGAIPQMPVTEPKINPNVSAVTAEIKMEDAVKGFEDKKVNGVEFKAPSGTKFADSKAGKGDTSASGKGGSGSKSKVGIDFESGKDAKKKEEVKEEGEVVAMTYGDDETRKSNFNNGKTTGAVESGGGTGEVDLGAEGALGPNGEEMSEDDYLKLAGMASLFKRVNIKYGVVDKDWTTEKLKDEFKSALKK